MVAAHRRGALRAPHCGHQFSVVRVHGSEDDARQQLDSVRADFTGIYISPVYEVDTGVYGWAICTACPVD
ncbi:MAG TPA: hypothetical protein VIE36_26725 [Methylomirabilota bacterium]|jgi:hypothetical protein